VRPGAQPDLIGDDLACKQRRPKVNLFDGTGIADGAVIGQRQDAGQPDAISDAGQPDPISEAVGRAGYLSPYTEAECLLASDEAAVFDRYYFPTGDEKAVYVDTVPEGLERARQEAEKQVAAKRKWCKKQDVTYMVVVEDTVTV
jgi:hypothetical protein